MPMVLPGDKVEKGQIIADGAATDQGELALGQQRRSSPSCPGTATTTRTRSCVSEKLVKDDVYTSIHIDEFEIEIRETKLGREEFTRDIPNVSERALRNLDETGIVRIGTRVQAGDILVGKVAPKSKSELTPEEKLLHAIFGRAGEDVKNDSLEVPDGRRGHRDRARRSSAARSTSPSRSARAICRRSRTRRSSSSRQYRESTRVLVEEAREALGGPVLDADGKTAIEVDDGHADARSAPRARRGPQPGRGRTTTPRSAPR